MRGGRRQIVGARLLLIAALAAVLWANLGGDSYTAFWETRLVTGIEDVQASFTIHAAINSGLMSFAFFVIALEVRREFVSGEFPGSAVLPGRWSPAPRASWSPR